MPSPETIFFALTGGILPALLWLWFWLHEDRLHPEPRSLIVLTFFAGMGAAILAFPLSRLSARVGFEPFTLLVVWVVIEEVLKWGAAHRSALRKTECDEPIDPLIYLITTALGFSALENALFLIDAIHTNGALGGITLGGSRFLGATVLHTVASGTVGIFIALAFYKKKFLRRLATFSGLLMAIVLHVFFNSFIISEIKERRLIVLLSMWLVAIIVMAISEKIKRLKTPPEE